MTTLSHEPVALAPERPNWSARILVPEMWTSLAIIAIWLSVLFVALFGPDIVTMDGVQGVGTSSTVPSAVAVALFAFLATWVVARYGYGQRRRD